LWNEEAWSQIANKKKDSDLEAFYSQGKQGSPHHAQSGIQEQQLRAEFSDFNVDGLRKFQNSKKYINPIAFSTPKNDPVFPSPFDDQKESPVSDFLNWDLNPTSSQKNAEHSTPGNDFSDFNFSNIPNSAHSSPFEHDIFSQKGINQTASGSEAAFWDTFGNGGPQKGGSSLHTHSEFSSHQLTQSGSIGLAADPFAHVSTKQQPPMSSSHELLQLSLGPDKDQTPLDQSTRPALQDAMQAGGTDHSQQSKDSTSHPSKPSELNHPPQGGSSFLELNIS
jgi:hypothetical protein